MANSIFWLLIEWPTRGSRLDNYAIHKRHTSAIVRVRPPQRRIITSGLLQAQISLLSLGYCVQPKLFLISTSLLSHCSANSFINVKYREQRSDKVCSGVFTADCNNKSYLYAKKCTESLL